MKYNKISKKHSTYRIVKKKSYYLIKLIKILIIDKHIFEK